MSTLFKFHNETTRITTKCTAKNTGVINTDPPPTNKPRNFVFQSYNPHQHKSLPAKTKPQQVDYGERVLTFNLSTSSSLVNGPTCTTPFSNSSTSSSFVSGPSSIQSDLSTHSGNCSSQNICSIDTKLRSHLTWDIVSKMDPTELKEELKLIEGIPESDLENIISRHMEGWYFLKPRDISYLGFSQLAISYFDRVKQVLKSRSA